MVLGRRFLQISLGGGIGLTFFLLVFGTPVLHPSYVNWLLEKSNQDSIQHLVGWEFFRNEPWHLPLGLITQFGYPIPTSIVYTDSIPLFALFFKFISPLFSQPFQYFGWWFALSYFLQGVFAFAISLHLTSNRLLQISLTLFFLLSPIMLNRTIEHQALVAHWLLLAGLLFYMLPYTPRMAWYWLVLNTLAVVIHAYLALMVLLLWIASLIKYHWIDKTLSTLCALKFISLTTGTVIMTAWVSGYFVIPFKSIRDAGGFTLDSFNLFSPIFPTTGSLVMPDGWSRIIPTMTTRYIEQGNEGFNYFGLGMLVILGVSFFTLISQPLNKITVKYWLPLLSIFSVLLVYSLSNSIYAGSHLLFSYSLPHYVFALSETFRASGRFFWPIYYGLMIISFSLLCRYFSTRSLIILFCGALMLQCFDLSNKLNELHHQFDTILTRNPDISILTEIPPHYAHLVFLPVITRPHVEIKSYESYLQYAATHNLSVNLGYLARQNQSDYASLGKQLLTEASQGHYQSDTIYVILNPHLAALLKHHLGKQDKMIRIGAYQTVLPGV